MELDSFKTASEVVYTNGKDEMNLIEFPFALLSNRNEGVKTLYFSDTIRGENGKSVFRKWTMTASDKFGMPTCEDEAVYVALMQITKENDMDSPKQFFTRYRVLRVMEWPDTGRYYNRIESALDRLMGVTIKAENAFYDPISRSYSTESFHILDNYRLWDRKDVSISPGQQALPLSFFKWNDIIWKSIKSGYIKNLDTRLWFALEGAVSRRLYRYLDKKFYRSSVFHIDYRKLALEKLGIARGSRPAKQKQLLASAADELIKRGYLKSYSFETAPGGTPVIVFKRVDRRETVPAPRLSDEQAKLKVELTQRGVTEKIADQLVLNYDGKLIQEKIELYEHLKSRNSASLSKSPAGFLRKAIEDNYTPPDSFQTRAQKQQRHERAAQLQREEELRRVECQYQDWLNSTDEQKVIGRLWIWKSRFRRDHGRDPSIEESRAKKEELIAALPTPEEYRTQLFSEAQRSKDT